MSNNVGRYDDEGDDYESEEEGLRLLLGGITVADVRSAAWDHFEEDDSVMSGSDTFRNDLISSLLDKSSKPTHNYKKLVPVIQPQPCSEVKDVFSYAYHSSPDGCVLPPVVITDMSSFNNRGNGLVASRFIRKGEIIYTEKAAVATQIPQDCSLLYPPPKTFKESPGPSKRTFPVRACQNCFRSLEPASSCSRTRGNKGAEASLPFPNLWPIPEYSDYQSLDKQDNRLYHVDKFGRVVCGECGSMFCSVPCRDAHNASVGSCCECMASIQAVRHTFECKRESRSSGAELSSDSNDRPDVLDVDLHPAAIIAARLLCVGVNKYRTDGTVGLGPVDGMCGDPQDLIPLEIGWMFQSNKDSEVSSSQDAHYFSLKPAYEAVSKSLKLTSCEGNHFSLPFFEHLAAVAARNSFNVATQSPFQPYYSSLIREVGGRGTEKHKNATETIARVLGSQEGTLNRDMDEKVARRCVVKTVGVFKLTARVNHSCDPCAEVREQQFVDCHIDLVAKRDIERGEEITISYINFGRMCGRAQDTSKRRRELQARYLFTCDCNRCTKNEHRPVSTQH